MTQPAQAPLGWGPTEPPAVRAARPMDVVGALEASHRFRRDSPLGSLFHPGKASFREMSPTASLHVLADGNRLSAHVDDVSPLGLRGPRPSRYACMRVMSHNLRGMAADARRRLLGRHGSQRCHLECEVVWVDDEADDHPTGSAPTPARGPVPRGRR